MKKRFNKSGQNVMGMSFGVIFSIILIIFIIVVAGIVIKTFLKTGDCARIGMFLDENDKTSFKFAVEKAWKSPGIDFDYEAKLPSSLEYVCFANFSSGINGRWEDIGEEINVYEDENLFLYPIDNSCNQPAHKIEHLNIAEITKTDNPYCIPVFNGKAVINIDKEINEGLVRIK